MLAKARITTRKQSGGIATAAAAAAAAAVMLLLSAFKFAAADDDHECTDAASALLDATTEQDDVVAAAVMQHHQVQQSSFVFLGCFFLLACYSLYLLTKQLAIVSRIAREQQASLCATLSYRIDYLMARSPWSMPIALLYMTAMLIVFGGLLMYLVSPRASERTLLQSVFAAWLFVADSAAHADYETTLELCVAILVTILGMIVFGFMIGSTSCVVVVVVVVVACVLLHQGAAVPPRSL
jgi:hypothetical protein